MQAHAQELSRAGSETLTVRIPTPLKREVDAEADRMRESRSVAARKIIRAGLDALRATSVAPGETEIV